MMDKIINVELLKNPMNWVIVILMIALAGLGYKAIFGRKMIAPSEE